MRESEESEDKIAYHNLLPLITKSPFRLLAVVFIPKITRAGYFLILLLIRD